MAQLKQLQQQLKDNDRPAHYSSLKDYLKAKKHNPLKKLRRLIDDDDVLVKPEKLSTKYDGLHAYLNYHYRDLLDDGELYVTHSDDNINKEIIDNDVHITNNDDRYYCSDDEWLWWIHKRNNPKDHTKFIKNDTTDYVDPVTGHDSMWDVRAQKTGTKEYNWEMAAGSRRNKKGSFFT
jgi:hypothetical protein